MDQSVRIKKLLDAISILDCDEFDADIAISSITSDSRKVIPGSLFVACPGENVDGHEFISSAVNTGAVAVVGEKAVKDLPIPYFQTINSRKALAYLSAAFYDYPARKMIMIGITGTDGKTTTTNILYRILRAAGYKTGMISTVNAVIGEKILDTGFHVTTPDSPDVQKYLALMVEEGITHVVLETTSHGWAQYRVDACDFDIGVVTNVTHEHLDQHGSYQNYLAAKGRLFSSLGESVNHNKGISKMAVLNQDDESYEYLRGVTNARTISYGLSDSSGYVVNDIDFNGNRMSFSILHPNSEVTDISSKLVGTYNALNCAAAFTAAVEGLGITPQIAVDGISSVALIPGRMENINCGQDFTAIVDFAHTPNALKVTLETVRKMTKGKVIAVFGSAGLRDREKRRLMAEISSSMADLSIFTAEDPRTESLNNILSEMANGADNKGGKKNVNYWCIPDRRDAIRRGVQLAKPGDILVCCGKGHEQSMCFGETEYLWDDRIALRAALSEFLGIEGPAMPILPIVEG